MNYIRNQLIEIYRQKGMQEFGTMDMLYDFLLGFNRDIGYDFTQNGINHNMVGGEILRDSEYKYWREVYYYGEAETKYQSLFLDILNMADMQIDKYGNDVGYEKRLRDIAERYGIDSEVYNKCMKLVEKYVSNMH